MSRKSVGAGRDDFRKLIESNGYFVDKTEFISEFLNNNAEVTLITRPRRFGKTINMTMLREFLDITKDTKELFKGTKIMGTEYAKDINSIPVVFLSFKNCDGPNKKKLLYSLMETIGEEYYRYEKIIKNSKTVSKRMLDKYTLEGFVALLKSKNGLKEILDLLKEEKVFLFTKGY